MKPSLTSSFLLFTIFASCQVHWDRSSNWTLYEYDGSRVFEIPIDSLKYCKSAPLNQDSMGTFMRSAAILNTKQPLAWMGGYIATCKIDGSLRKVEVSTYGGYFYDQKSGTYYQMPEEKIDAWLLFFQTSYLTLIQKK